MPVKKFVIDRSKWLNGELYKRAEKANGSAPGGVLLDAYGRMCCLGFYSKACGAKRLQDEAMPNYLSKRSKLRLDSRIADPDSWWGDGPTPLADKLQTANDTERGRPETREAKIKKLFKTIGVTVTFKGSYPKPEDIKP